MHSYVPRSTRQLRRLLKGMPVGMLTTHTIDGASHSRPMLMHEVDDAGWLWFVTDRHSRKTCELSQNPHTTIAFQSKKGNRYVSVQGTAVVVRDDVKLKELWNPSMRAWFPRGRRDPEIALVAVRVERAEYWIVPPTRIARVLAATTALVTGKRHENGRHGVLDLHPTFA
ncbi:MAG TPA: pyridoxamine 5'-phosphate oxidase family protein [Vicinamibacterales bacterium]|nr:pyridoxamine 5'-phosphate oxidase family protein [Vicinamibacterales bacterium]